ncbi:MULTISPECIES: permease prefix domain 1-containing protein [unclassified Oceanobacillus]|uniref:permease prefix domain 1-containing protein n=1 Tax=unclassified Oceanobacillus TaxID=2630292 RepID=UPI00300DE14F
MTKVDEYVEKLYKNANPNHPETIELKEETRTHLYDSIKEIKCEGYSENEAFEIAVERYGGFEQAEKLISLMKIRQKTFAKWLLTIGLISLLIGGSSFIILLYIGNVHDEHFAEIGYGIEKNLTQLNGKNFEQSFTEEPSIINAYLYNTEQSRIGSPDLTYRGKNQWVPSLFKREAFYGMEHTLISLEVVDVRTIGFLLFIVGFTAYYILFTLWGLIQLYHTDHLTILWITLLVLLNALGYLLFLLKKQRKKIPMEETYEY